MAGNYDNNNSGAIFRNDKKTTDKHPDGTGTCTIDGVEYFVSMWNKVSKKGMQFKSLAFTRKEKQQGGRQGSGSYQVPRQTQQASYDSDDIPF